MQGATRRIAGLQSHLNHVQGSGEEDEQPVGSVWTNMPQAPPDPILGLTEAFKADPSPSKLNLGVGAYRTEEGKPLVLEVVKKAVARVVSNPAGNKEYLGIAGLPEFCDRARALAFGEFSEGVTSQRIATVQSLSGTGALRVGAEFLRTHYPVPVVYLPQPTWGNHKKIFPNAGLAVRTYRYYHPASRGLDFEGMVEDLKSAEPGAVVLLHACAHNPTGVDPGREQWCQLLEVVRSRRLLPFFDSAYQGFASGDLDQDAFALRLFAESGLQMLLAQSFAKNMGLYGERAGALSVVSADREEAARVLSQLKQVVRPMYSNPPRHGAEIVATVLGDATLFAEWKVELKEMAGRIQAMRQALYDELSARGVPGTWTHILHQIGMFTFTGLTAAQVDHLIRRWHIYLTADGRISMAGLSRSSCGYLADAILDAIRTC